MNKANSKKQIQRTECNPAMLELTRCKVKKRDYVAKKDKLSKHKNRTDECIYICTYRWRNYTCDTKCMLITGKSNVGSQRQAMPK